MISVDTPAFMSSAAGAPPPDGLGEQSDRLPDASLAVPILVVEDEAMIAWMMECVLEEMGFTTITVVATGEDAIAHAKTTRPGLILSDINLGADHLDGVDAVTSIRGATRLPIIFISAYANADARERIKALPGAHLMRKPITVAELRYAVERAFAADQLN